MSAARRSDRLIFFFSKTQQPLVGQGLKASRSHSVGLLWTSDRPGAEDFTEFEPAIPASERMQTHTWNRAATGTGTLWYTAEEIGGASELGFVSSASRQEVTNKSWQYKYGV